MRLAPTALSDIKDTLIDQMARADLECGFALYGPPVSHIGGEIFVARCGTVGQGTRGPHHTSRDFVHSAHECIRMKPLTECGYIHTHPSSSRALSEFDRLTVGAAREGLATPALAEIIAVAPGGDWGHPELTAYVCRRCVWRHVQLDLSVIEPARILY